MCAPNLITETPLHFAALDGYSLGGTLFASLEIQAPHTVGLFSCGVGIAASRYARFARFLAAKGIPILVFDYRGIGSSRTTSLRHFPALAEDWSELDCGGAIAHLRARFGGANLVAVTHSIGALLACGAPNIAEISRFVFICPHTGYHRDYSAKYRMPMAVLWHGLMPILTRLVGYFPAKRLGLGEDIPHGVAMQWAARRGPRFQPEATATEVSRARLMIARYPLVTGAALALGFSDDAFATEAGMRRLLSTFPKLRAEVKVISPASFGMNGIGHFGFFRRESEFAIWPMVLEFLVANTLPQAESPAA